MTEEDKIEKLEAELDAFEEDLDTGWNSDDVFAAIADGLRNAVKNRKDN